MKVIQIYNEERIAPGCIGVNSLSFRLFPY